MPIIFKNFTMKYNEYQNEYFYFAAYYPMRSLRQNKGIFIEFVFQKIGVSFGKYYYFFFYCPQKRRFVFRVSQFHSRGIFIDDGD